MQRYPNLKDETERLINQQLKKKEEDCKEHLQLYIDIQISYINTNHEEFIGFAKYINYETFFKEYVHRDEV